MPKFRISIEMIEDEREKPESAFRFELRTLDGRLPFEGYICKLSPKVKCDLNYDRDFVIGMGHTGCADAEQRLRKKRIENGGEP